MKSAKYNDRKFNRRTGNAFPIKQHRFDTTKHPIVLDKGRRAASIKTSVSHDEEMMIVGLTNSLGVNRNDSIRIALYEAALATVETLEMYLPYCDPKSKKHGHTDRNTGVEVKLRGKEKTDIQHMANTLGVSDKTFIRLAIIFLEKGIRKEQITKLTDSRKLTQLECKKNHWENNEFSGESKLIPLRQTQQKNYDVAQDEGHERDYEIYVARGDFMERMELNGEMLPRDYNGEIDIHAVDQLMIMEEEELLEEFWKKNCEGESKVVQKTMLAAYYESKGWDEKIAEDKAEMHLLWIEEQKQQQEDFERNKDLIEKEIQEWENQQPMEVTEPKPVIKVRYRSIPKSPQERLDNMSIEERAKYAQAKKEAKERSANIQKDLDERIAKHNAWMAENYPNGLKWTIKGIEKGDPED